MCELLFRVADKTNSNCPYLDAKCTKRGDVIHVAEDGHEWGTEELRHVDWRIFRLPSLPAENAAAFLAPELGTDPKYPSSVLQARGFQLNLEHALLKAAQEWIADDKRVTPIYTLPLKLKQLMALKVQKPALEDPRIL